MPLEHWTKSPKSTSLCLSTAHVLSADPAFRHASGELKGLSFEPQWASVAFTIRPQRTVESAKVVRFDPQIKSLRVPSVGPGVHAVPTSSRCLRSAVGTSLRFKVAQTAVGFIDSFGHGPLTSDPTRKLGKRKNLLFLYNFFLFLFLFVSSRRRRFYLFALDPSLLQKSMFGRAPVMPTDEDSRVRRAVSLALVGRTAWVRERKSDGNDSGIQSGGLTGARTGPPL